jgi:hypothetical protein
MEMQSIQIARHVAATGPILTPIAIRKLGEHFEAAFGAAAENMREARKKEKGMHLLIPTLSKCMMQESSPKCILRIRCKRLI